MVVLLVCAVPVNGSCRSIDLAGGYAGMVCCSARIHPDFVCRSPNITSRGVQLMICPKCGKKLSDTSILCTSCGWKSDKWKSDSKNMAYKYKVLVVSVVVLTAIALAGIVAVILM